MATPKPGTQEAQAAGCTCPVLDNCYGRGYYGTGVFVYVEGCPIHPFTPPESYEVFEAGWCDECYEESRPCACERLAADYAGPMASGEV